MWKDTEFPKHCVWSVCVGRGQRALCEGVRGGLPALVCLLGGWAPGRAPCSRGAIGGHVWLCMQACGRDAGAGAAQGEASVTVPTCFERLASCHMNKVSRSPRANGLHGHPARRREARLVERQRLLYMVEDAEIALRMQSRPRRMRQTGRLCPSASHSAAKAKMHLHGRS